MIRSVLSLRAREGQAEALEEFFRDRGILDRARRFPGCQGTTLWRAETPTTPGAAAPGAAVPAAPYTHLVFADWDGPADYHRWVTDPWRADVSDDLAALLDVSPDEQIVGGLFEPVDDAPRRTDGNPTDNTGAAGRPVSTTSTAPSYHHPEEPPTPEIHPDPEEHL